MCRMCIRHHVQPTHFLCAPLMRHLNPLTVMCPLSPAVCAHRTTAYTKPLDLSFELLEPTNRSCLPTDLSFTTNNQSPEPLDMSSEHPSWTVSVLYSLHPHDLLFVLPSPAVCALRHVVYTYVTLRPTVCISVTCCLRS
jgi:hypothetical protein